MNIFTVLILGFIILEFLIEWSLSILNLNQILKQRHKIPPLFQATVDDETHQQSTDYNLRKGQFALFSGLFNRLLLVILLVTGIPGLFLNFMETWIESAYLSGFLFLILGSGFMSLIQFPFSLYSQFVIEEEYGFNTTTFKTLILDSIKAFPLSLILTALLYGALHGSLLLFGSSWWIIAWASITVLQFLLIMIYPVLIAPLFNKFTPLPEGDLKNHLSSLAKQCGFAHQGIFVMDGSRRSRHSNAYFTGFGKARRIVLFDNLIESMDPESITAVLAHEIGHWKKNHVKKRMFLSILSTFVIAAMAGWLLTMPSVFTGFGFNHPSLPALLIILGYYFSPISNMLSPIGYRLSRKHEYEADAYAVKNAGADGMKSALLNLGKHNLSNLSPHPAYAAWHASHPVLIERIEAIERLEKTLSSMEGE
ncbi:MAG: M48 family metallopeptidase [Spirochaetales bacterium]|nr:M48 family metallopeptidase [Spirochaetales bacterium]